MIQRKGLLLLSLITGFSVMVVELTAARIIAPILGNSIYTWTSVIGIVLLGTSLGNYVGGRIIDKRDKSDIIANFFLLSSFFILYIPIFAQTNSEIAIQIKAFWVATITLSAILFFIPSFFLGAIYPMIIKYFITNTCKIGQDTGSLSASWSIGSILGTFLTGFVFIGYIGSTGTLLTISALLFCCSLWLKRGVTAKLLIALLYIILFILYFNIKNNEKALSSTIFHKESNYYDIRVADKELSGLGKVRILFLDAGANNIESTTNENFDSYTNFYPVFSVFNNNIKDIAMLGGGSLEISDNLKKYYPTSNVTTAEIDPEVILTAKNYFGTSEYTTSNTKPIDGRIFLTQSEKKYDVIFSDAYNSFISVPWHLTTIEFFNLAKTKLNTNGMIAINVISSREGSNSAFYKSILKTFSSVFNNYYIFAYGGNNIETQNIILFGFNSTNHPTNESLKAKILTLPDGIRLAQHLKSETLPDDSVLILTDNFAPTDRLLMPTIDDYFHPYMSFFQPNI